MVRQCIGYSRGYSNCSIKEILEETESDKTKIECLKKKYCFSERLLNSSYVMHINISKHLVKINFLKTICPEKLKMRECPAKRSEQKEKERQKYIRQKEQGIRKSIKEKLKMRECPAKRSEQKEKERQKYIRQKEQGIRKVLKDANHKETAYLVCIRLKKLCESRCQDLALNLATVFMDCCAIAKINFNGTDDQICYIYDILIALLHKFHFNDELIAKMKNLSFEKGLQFAERFANKQVRYLKLWENSREIAVLALQIYISQIMIKYDRSLSATLSNFVKLYKSICSAKSYLESFSESMERISNLTDSDGLQDLCDILREEYDPALKPLILKIYLKMLTAEMNINEGQSETEEITSINRTEPNLPRILTSLADFFDDHVNVARECLLTAFCICPTKERLRQIENLARRSGFEVVDMEESLKCSHLLVDPFLDKAESQCLCGDWVNKPELELPKINIPLYKALTEPNLPRILTSLADFFDDHVNVARECLLTAFCICPTKERLRQIENLARRSGFEVVDMEESLKCHLLVDPFLDKAESQCLCGDWVNKPELELPKINIPLYKAL
nr:unnamed protein product [Callosobruchus chinensis]